MSVLNVLFPSSIPRPMFRRDVIEDVKADVTLTTLEEYGQKPLIERFKNNVVDGAFTLKAETPEDRTRAVAFWARFKTVCVLTGVVEQGLIYGLSYYLFKRCSSLWVKAAVGIAAAFISYARFNHSKIKYRESNYEGINWSSQPGISFIDNRDHVKRLKHEELFTRERINGAAYLHPKELEDRYAKNLESFKTTLLNPIMNDMHLLPLFFEKGSLVNPFNRKVIKIVFGKMPQTLESRAKTFETLFYLHLRINDGNNQKLFSGLVERIKKASEELPASPHKEVFLLRVLAGLTRYELEVGQEGKMARMVRQFLKEELDIRQISVADMIPFNITRNWNIERLKALILESAPKEAMPEYTAYVNALKIEALLS